MKESNYISPLIKFSLREQVKEDRKISYSQYAMYAKCPKQWELGYAKGLRTFQESIHTLFGRIKNIHTLFGNCIAYLLKKDMQCIFTRQLI